MPIVKNINSWLNLLVNYFLCLCRSFYILPFIWYKGLFLRNLCVQDQILDSALNLSIFSKRANIIKRARPLRKIGMGSFFTNITFFYRENGKKFIRPLKQMNKADWCAHHQLDIREMLQQPFFFQVRFKMSWITNFYLPKLLKILSSYAQSTCFLKQLFPWEQPGKIIFSSSCCSVYFFSIKKIRLNKLLALSH